MDGSQEQHPPPYLVGPFLDHLARRLRTDGGYVLTMFGVRPRHVTLLALLRDFGERSQAELANLLGMDATNVVALLNELEARELVVRRRAPSDRRRHVVSITAAGEQALAEMAVEAAVVEDRLLSALSDDERRQLHALLQRAAARTAAEGPSPADA